MSQIYGTATDKDIAPAARRRAHPWRIYRSWINIVVLALSDILAFSLAIVLFRTGHAVPEVLFLPGARIQAAPVDIVFVMGIVFVGARYVFGDYSRRRPFWDGARSTTLALIVTSVPSFLILMAFPGQYSLLTEVGTWLFLFFAVPFLRQFARLLMTRAGVWRMPTALVAGGSRAREIYAALSNTFSLGYEVFWVVQEELGENLQYNGHKLKPILLTDPAELVTALVREGCDQTILACEDMEPAKFDNLVQRLMEADISVTVAPSFRRLQFVGSAPSYFFGRDILLFQVRNSIQRFPQRFFKRTFDIIGSLAALVFLSPLFLVVAVVIKSKYPAVPLFFGHKSVGKDGRSFRAWKFSTMIPDAHLMLDRVLANNEERQREWNESYKLRDDPRVLPGIGNLLRRWSLNELPQFFNVLVGDMSLVGPRPVTERELVRYYGPAAQLYRRVRPGITGLWQISGRSDTTYEERIVYDEWYILNWSFWYDLVILFQTIWIVLSGKGAY